MTSAAPDAPAIRQELTEVAVYERSLPVSLERIWENVLDWEHLPWLHRDSFASIEPEQTAPGGWRARIGIRTGRGVALHRTEVVLDRPGLRYVTRTLEGKGQGTEIWTALEPVEARRTSIRVAFKLPLAPGAAVGDIARRLVATYTRLWDEDEAMMRRRQTLLDARGEADESRMGPQSIPLGRLDALRARLPLVIEAFGAQVRVLLLGDALVAHPATCPHLGGPLEASPVEDGCVVCPWHGYRFDLRTGRSCDGRAFVLAPGLRVRVEEDSQQVVLERAAGAR